MTLCFTLKENGTPMITANLLSPKRHPKILAIMIPSKPNSLNNFSALRRNQNLTKNR